MSAIAADTSADGIAKIVKFVDENLSCCKQHVYIFARQEDAVLPETVLEGDRVLDVGGARGLYIARVKYNIVLREPLEETTLEFLWPMLVELQEHYAVVRFVVLEKNPASYFIDRPVYVAGKNIDEKRVLMDFAPSNIVTAADINKGIKKLWADGLIDSSRTKYKKTLSTAMEAMDEEEGIKEYNPELYAVVQGAPLYTTLFQVAEDKSTVSTFSADPSNGIVGFTRYTEKKGDTDVIIQEILENNQ